LRCDSGARAQKRGLFELANKGTLFLDEIGETPLSIQAKLLRVLEGQCFRRLGGLHDITVDVRIIAATNKMLSEAVKAGAFRQDLYYRLNGIQVTVPALRERPQDILPLARFFVDLYNRKFKRQVDGISPEAESLLLAHDWPGNVRELRNAIERGMILEDASLIQAGSLPIAVRSPTTEASAAAPAGEGMMSLPEQERRLLVHALSRCGGNQTQAARLLRITRDTLRYKVKKFNLS
jgi:transcriptional regulator with PAS, ATPase and Fis domain